LPITSWAREYAIACPISNSASGASPIDMLAEPERPRSRHYKGGRPQLVLRSPVRHSEKDRRDQREYQQPEQQPEK
jgi:hypothetical protein